MKKSKGIIAIAATTVLMTGCAHEPTFEERNQQSFANIQRERDSLYPPKWVITCNVDKFTDTKSCEMKRFFVSSKNEHHKEKNSVYESASVTLTDKQNLELRFGFQDDPTIGGQIRFGKNEPEKFNQFLITGNQANKVLSQMQSEKSGIVETYKWPNNRVYFEIDLQDFNLAYAELKKSISK